MDDEGGLDLKLRDILYAFELAGAHYSNKGNARDRLESRKEIAEGLLDWAMSQTKRHKKLLEAMARQAYQPRGPDITFLGPFEI